MIENRICPYCRQSLIKAEDAGNCRSVEHLIPNAALTRRRKNNQGDFYACRKCNSRKSNIDYILGVVTKAQSADDELAASTMIDAVTNEDGRSKRFVDMIFTAREEGDGVHMEMPIRGNELIEYLHYLGKGQFFKMRRVPYDPNQQVMEIQFVNKYVLGGLEKSYNDMHCSNPFDDLKTNPRSEVISDGECIIWLKNNQFLFVFHNYIAVIVSVLRKTKKNEANAAKSERYLLDHFTYAI
jgi:hypothetical protein